MRIHHQGLQIELQDGDARIPIIEAVLFGKTLPPPVPLAGVLGAQLGGADAATGARMRVFWSALTPVERRELVMLAENPMTPAATEDALGVSTRQLQGAHSRINRFARKHRVPAAIRGRGRGRRRRRYFVSEEGAVWIRALASEPTPVTTTTT